jgi:hypothetical protein
LALKQPDVTAFGLQFFIDRCKELLGSVGIEVCEVLTSQLKFIRVLVKAVISQMHVHVLHIDSVRLLVIRLIA